MSENEIVKKITSSISTILPEGVFFSGLKQEQSSSNLRTDISGTISTPQKNIDVNIEVKNTDRISGIREAAFQAKNYAQNMGTAPMIGTTYMGERARQVAKEEGVGYVDLAGNFFLNKKGVYIEKIVDKNPNTVKTTLKNLFAPVSSRIIRALLIEPDRRWILADIANETSASIGQIYKVIEKLIGEELVKRDDEDKIILVNPKVLLEEWKKVYPEYEQLKRSFYNFKVTSIEATPSFIEAVNKENIKYALGFFTGAYFIAPFITGVNKIQAYVESSDNIETLKKELGMEEVESGGNVELYVPYDQGVFYKPQVIDNKQFGKISVVSNVQLYMDLFSNPARGAEQAEHLRQLKLKF